MDERSLADALRRLDERLARLERAAGVESAASRPPSPPPPPPLPAHATIAPPEQQPIHEPAIAQGSSLAPPAKLTNEQEESVRGHGAAPPAAPVSLQSLFKAPSAAPSSGISESLLGGRVTAWVGAVLVMIGAGVFVKYAYDQGWLRNLGEMGRFMLATSGAVVLIVLGEVAMRRYGRAAAAGLFAAGIGSLFVIASAGTLPNVMLVYGPGGAAIFALLAAILGVVVARRSGQLAVGVIVVIGAYLVPIFSGVLRMESALAAPAYLTAVLVLALTLANLATVHRSLRVVALVMHLIVGTFFLLHDATPPLWKQAFVFLWWGLFVADAIIAALQNDESERDQSGPAVVTVATVVSVVASFAFAGAWAGWRDPWAWMPAAQAVACLAIAAQLHAMRGERGAARALDELITALTVLGGALVGVAIALLFKPEAASVAWALMGGATIFIAAQGRARNRLAVFGIMVMVPACAVASWLAVSGRLGRGGGAPPLELPLPGLSQASLVFGANWWLTALVAVIAFASARAVRHWQSSAVQGLLVAIVMVAWGVTAFVVDRHGSGLLVASALPMAWLVLARIDDDPLSQRAAFSSAIILMGACAVAALADASGVDVSVAIRAIALMLATAIVVAASPGGNAPTVVGVAVALAVIAFIEIAGGQVPGQAGSRAVGEVLVFAGIVALASIIAFAVARGSGGGAMRAVLPRDLSPLAIWAALAWLWAAVVLALKLGLDDATPMANLMNATAALVLSALAVFLWTQRVASLAAAFALVMLVAGSWDLTRLVRHLAEDAQTATTLRQAMLSAWWAAVAVAAVIAGFAWRLTPLRWMALVLLAITAAKVLVVDLSGAATLARVGALLVVGLLLVGTSIVYARAERRLREIPAGP